jgi:peptidoglycan/LPS O-acetylase OafA/YrhL
LPMAEKNAPGVQVAGTRRLDWLDALRGWAVLGVVLTHSGGASHNTGITQKIASSGQYGVQLFFIVSALTISLTYDSHIARYGRSLRSQFAWLIKRFFRIAPLYYVAAFVYPVIYYAMWVQSHHRYGSLTTIGQIVANLLFIHAWVPSANNSVVPGGWSIGVEMFFYLLVPLIWLITPKKLHVRAAVLGFAAAALLCVTQLTNQAVTETWYVPDNTYLYYWFPTQAPVILIGLILYFLHGTRLRSQESLQKTIPYLAMFLLCIPVALFCGTVGKWMPILSPSILAIGFVLLILGLNDQIKSVLVNKYSIFLGQISFSVYILHFAVLDAMQGFLQLIHFRHFTNATLLVVFPFAVLITSGLAYLSKKFVEDPFIAYGHRLSQTVAQAGVQKPVTS